MTMARLFTVVDLLHPSTSGIYLQCQTASTKCVWCQKDFPKELRCPGAAKRNIKGYVTIILLSPQLQLCQFFVCRVTPYVSLKPRRPEPGNRVALIWLLPLVYDKAKAGVMICHSMVVINNALYILDLGQVQWTNRCSLRPSK